MNDDLRNRRRANLQRLLNPRHIAFVGGRAGEEGAALQARLNEVAGDLALVGPNCLGVLNQFDGSAVWGGGNVVQSVRDTGVALISQSGYIAYSITNVEQAFPLGYAISIGNQAVLDVADFIDAMLRDKRVRAIGLYLEGIVDIAALSAAALCAVEIGIPLVVLKAGGTTEGADLAHSHSGTLAVDDEIWSALFRRLAMVEVGSPKALIETLKLLGASKPPQGKRIVATANSGAYAAMIAEKGKALGLAFPGPTDAQRDALRETVPDLVSLFNPLDWNLPWASMATPEISYAGMGILLDDRCDLLVYFVDWPRQKDVADVWWPTLEGLIRLNEQSDCPVVIASVLPDGLPAELRQRLAEAGVSTLQGLDDALTAISAAASYIELREFILADSESRLLPPPVGGDRSAKTLNEAEGKAILAEYGVAVPEGVTGTLQEIIAKADHLTYPLAVKLLNADLAHKNRAGAVHLNVRDASELAEAIRAIQSSVATYDKSLGTNCFLIEQMVEDPRAEFIAGISRKPGVGHALVIGRGGTAVEEHRDFVTLLLPASPAQIREALKGLGISRQLRLAEGEIVALTETFACVARFATDNREKLVELDVNPIIFDASGGVTAVDVFIRIDL